MDRFSGGDPPHVALDYLTSCSEADGDSDFQFSDLEPSSSSLFRTGGGFGFGGVGVGAGAGVGGSHDDTDVEGGFGGGGGSGEGGAPKRGTLPSDALAALRSVLLPRRRRPFRLASTLASAAVPVYYLHDDLSLAIPIGLSSTALAARYRRSWRDCDALAEEWGRRAWCSFQRRGGAVAGRGVVAEEVAVTEKVAADGGADSGGGGLVASNTEDRGSVAALEALELLTRLPSSSSAGGCRPLPFSRLGSRAELLARAARDPRSKRRILVELSQYERKDRAVDVLLAVASAALALLCWTTLMDPWPFLLLGALLLLDARSDLVNARATDRLADGLYALAVAQRKKGEREADADADAAGGRDSIESSSNMRSHGGGFGELCDASDLRASVGTGTSWVISPLFEKLGEKRPGSGGSGRRRKVKSGSEGRRDVSGEREGERSARRRRKKGASGGHMAGVV